MFAVSRHRLAFSTRITALVTLVTVVLPACTDRAGVSFREPDLKARDVATIQLVRNAFSNRNAQSRTVALVLGARECASCRGVGLALRTLQQKLADSPVVIHDLAANDETQELLHHERIEIERVAVPSEKLRFAIGGDLGGAMVVLDSSETRIFRISPREDWPTSVARALTQLPLEFRRPEAPVR